MKKLITLLLSLVLVVSLSGCADYAANTTECEPVTIEVEVPGECSTETETETPAAGPAEIDGLGIYYVNHISGEGHEVSRPVKVLFEFKTLKFTKYQIAYLSCTWRPAERNYEQVAYVELDKNGTIKFLSFDVDSDGHYTPAVWGDSSPTPGGKTKDDFAAELIPYFTGMTVDELAAFSTIDDMTDFEQVDSYAGSSVSVNNMLRALQGLQEYHMNK